MAGWDQLPARVADGDEVGFAALYDALAPCAYGLAVRIVRDRAHAEDVTQEVFVQLWTTAPRYDPHRRTALTWAITVTHRRAVDRVRAERLRRDPETIAGSVPLADPVGGHLQLVVDRDLIVRCLAELTLLQRRVIVDAYYGGCTCPEVAQRLSATVPVKTRIRDGLRNLRACLTTTRVT
ncbi:sigma-70 family RNA polymerase sigma factor [Tenggerimyces flavus]|uniref:Sigma-70 family RNA polymerase sigma factor n=1 Tax=Tenggerimyces flavus TaxID=1708749 RepID=A0ABV7YC42_9ACTN|nr:sigma-70 family RNA polymerase sigma factor [Tenggerimyces flavus]MBM7790279.1 RNA polymerase sigma-70 factor (ECF subfamily) [Tenggerimyces flavus]